MSEYRAYLWSDGYWYTTPEIIAHDEVRILRAERDHLRDQNADLLGQLDAVTFAHNVMQDKRDRLRDALDGIIEAAGIAGYSTQRGLLAQRINAARTALQEDGDE